MKSEAEQLINEVYFCYKMTVDDKDLLANRQALNNSPRPRPNIPRPHRPTAGSPQGVPMNPNSQVHQEMQQRVTYLCDPDW